VADAKGQGSIVKTRRKKTVGWAVPTEREGLDDGQDNTEKEEEVIEGCEHVYFIQPEDNFG